MATWITHFMIADRIMEALPWLHRRGFCAGNVAPDCNVENEDWTAFIPPREVTHWMQGQRKTASDCDPFCEAYILPRKDLPLGSEEYGFLLGYYAHLLTDAAFQAYLRDEERVRAAWDRIRADEALWAKAQTLPQTWDAVKQLIPKDRRMHEMYSLEAEYLRDHPESGYLTELLPIKEFPDYIDYMPENCIVRKLSVMGFIPEVDNTLQNPIGFSRQELQMFTENTVRLVLRKFHQMGLTYRIIPYESLYRDDMIFMVLQAKDALGRVPALNTDLLDIESHYLAKGDRFWLAVDGSRRVIGCVGYHAIPGTTEARLHRLYVKASMKRQGIGSALLGTVETHLRSIGITAAHVHMGGQGYFESYSFYPKHGYTEYAPRYMKKEL